MKIRTRVRFKDGVEDVQDWLPYVSTWPDGVPRYAELLTFAVSQAEERHHGEDHDGAWLEFVS